MGKRNKPKPAPEPAPAPDVEAQAEPTPSASPRYRVRAGAPDHWDGHRFIPAGGVIVLGPGVKPGRWLDPID